MTRAIRGLSNGRASLHDFHAMTLATDSPRAFACNGRPLQYRLLCSQAKAFQVQCLTHPQWITITHKKITKLIPKQFRFGNSSTQITEYNSNNNSVRDSVILCSHCLPRSSNSRNKIRFGNHRAGITEKNSKIIKFGSVIVLCVMVHERYAMSQSSIHPECLYVCQVFDGGVRLRFQAEISKASCKGETQPKSTHPNKSTVCTNNFRTACAICPLFSAWPCLL